MSPGTPRRGDGAGPNHPSAADLLAPSWMTRNISIAPFGPGWWSFNPSVHHDRLDERWRCVFRCANYTLPGGVPRLSSAARAGKAETRNAIATLDPATLELSGLREVRELDDAPRAPACSSLGYEDMRIFRTQHDGLCGIATALQLNLEHPSVPEMVLVRLDQHCDIVEARPLRGSWSHRPQKNWSPFDGTERPRLLYSIERGIVMGPRGPVAGPPPTNVSPPRPSAIVAAGPSRCGVEVRVVTNGQARTLHQPVAPPAPGSTELRGGSQLVRIDEGLWLGIAHEMKLLAPRRRKYYWHTLYAVDDEGRMILRSPAMKLSPRHGIEFAAGLAVDDRGGVAISYGTDDHESWIAVTSLDAIFRILAPVERKEAAATGESLPRSPRSPRRLQEQEG